MFWVFAGFTLLGGFMVGFASSDDLRFGFGFLIFPGISGFCLSWAFLTFGFFVLCFCLGFLVCLLL